MPDDPGAGVAFSMPLSPLPSCDAPITDAHGEWIGIGLVYHTHAYRFVSASSPGEPIGALGVGVSMYGGPAVAPQPDGYHAIDSRELPGHFRRYDAKGTLLSEDTQTHAWAIQGVPGGGSVTVTVENLFATNGQPAVYRLVWRDTGGDVQAEAVMPGGDPLIAVSSTGHVLAFAAGQARWYGRDGAPITDWFPFGGDARLLWTYNEVLAGALSLADGSVVVGLGGPHPLRFEADATRAGPPPDWVLSRAGGIAAAVRGGRANAFAWITSARGQPCEVKLELLTPAGESCGTLELSSPDACETVSFGADRTFLAQGFSGGSCVWRWWSALLR
jgi:hypothetical protein